MSNLNRLTLIGNVGTEPEYVDFESGARLTKFTLAVGRYDKKNNADVTDWFNVETFSKLGDYLKKGIKVCVDGSIETNVYQNKDGQNIKKFIVKGRTLEILTPKKDREEGNTDTNTNNENDYQEDADASNYSGTEDLGCNADYPEEMNDSNAYPEIPSLDDISDDEIPF